MRTQHTDWTAIMAGICAMGAAGEVALGQARLTADNSSVLAAVNAQAPVPIAYETQSGPTAPGARFPGFRQSSRAYAPTDGVISIEPTSGASLAQAASVYGQWNNADAAGRFTSIETMGLITMTLSRSADGLLTHSKGEVDVRRGFVLDQPSDALYGIGWDYSALQWSIAGFSSVLGLHIDLSRIEHDASGTHLVSVIDRVLDTSGTWGYNAIESLPLSLPAGEYTFGVKFSIALTAIGEGAWDGPGLRDEAFGEFYQGLIIPSPASGPLVLALGLTMAGKRRR